MGSGLAGGGGQDPTEMDDLKFGAQELGSHGGVPQKSTMEYMHYLLMHFLPKHEFFPLNSIYSQCFFFFAYKWH